VNGTASLGNLSKLVPRSALCTSKVSEYFILIHFFVLHCTDYERSNTVKHSTLVLVIQCYMYGLYEPSAGITLQKLKKKRKFTCRMRYLLVRYHCFTNVYQNTPRTFSVYFDKYYNYY